jgi:serine/threonine-protein kinase
MRKKIIVLLAILLPAMSAMAQGSDTEAPAETVSSDDPVAEATIVARAWPALVDEGAYGQSWTEAAALFKKAIGQTDWIKTVRNVRQPLGAVSSRQLIGGQYATELPQAPEGEYVVLQFRTNFAGKMGAVETITPMRDSDGAWRAAGYYIK